MIEMFFGDLIPTGLNMLLGWLGDKLGLSFINAIKENEDVQKALVLYIVLEILSVWLVAAAMVFVIAAKKDVLYSIRFILTTILMPPIGLIWAAAAGGGKKYRTWDAKDISDASYEDTQKCIPHLATEKLKEFALREARRKEALEPKPGYNANEFEH